ncbi:MAG: putative DNA-binding domain-containing protein [Gammaproteobacteria bacterium]|nr:putative DNA-binding domain-containing protein [Gammaproteobacteria bacterium]
MSTAPSLPELQRAFTRWVLGDQQVPLPQWVAGNGLASEIRLGIYRNTIFNNLTAALHTAYPAVLKLVGEDFFEGAAARYIREQPSRSGNLQDYGAAFPALLAQMPEAAGLAYLADVARLEWARQEAWLAADADALGPETLAAVPEDRQTALRLQLHPGLRLVASAHPVLAIWEFCQQDKPDHLQLDQAGQRVLLWRDNSQVAMRGITADWYGLLTLLLAGESLAGATQTTLLNASPDFDLGACLRMLFAAGLVTGCRWD